MGLIAGISSRDGSDISELLHIFAVKLCHRGNSEYSVFIKNSNGWETILCEDAREILTLKSHFGIIGRHMIWNRQTDTIPYSDCQNTRFLLFDGELFDVETIKQELTKSHRGYLNNPSAILHLMEELKEKIFDFSQIFRKIFRLMNGMYAAALIMKHYVFLFRDLIGIKPLYLHVGPKYVAFASERKALWAAGLTDRIEPLRPGRVVRFAEKGITSHYQLEYNPRASKDMPLEHYIQRLLNSLRTNIAMLRPSIPFALLLSGGIDSTILAILLKQSGNDFRSIVVGSKKSKDIQMAQDTAECVGVPLEILQFDLATLENCLPSLIYHVESRDEKKINIAFPLFYASKHLHEHRVQTVFTGQGADELFGGYERHELQFQQDASKLPEDLWNDVKSLYKGNLQRDDAVAMAHTMQLRLPYLTRDLIELSMQIPPNFKIQPPVRKYILRQVGIEAGLPKRFTQQPKRAIQFSSGSYETLKKLSRKIGFTKDFALSNGFFSPTQLFIDALTVFLGFPNKDPKVLKFVEETRITWPDTFWDLENIVNRVD